MTDAPDITPLLAHVVPYTLVLFRLAGVFLAAPMLTSAMIPRKHRALIAAMLAASIYPGVAGSLRAPASVDLFGLVPLVLGEGLIGFAIGAIAALPLAAMELAGAICGHEMGFGLARVYNPETDADTELLGQLLYYIAFGAFLAMGGFEAIFATLLATFSRIPVGGFGASDTPLDLFVGVLQGGFDLALRVSAPVTGIVLLIAIVLGVIGKTVPQINVLSIGFTIKIMGGLIMLALSIYAIGSVSGDLIAGTMRDLARLFGA